MGCWSHWEVLGGIWGSFSCSGGLRELLLGGRGGTQLRNPPQVTLHRAGLGTQVPGTSVAMSPHPAVPWWLQGSQGWCPPCRGCWVSRGEPDRYKVVLVMCWPCSPSKARGLMPGGHGAPSGLIPVQQLWGYCMPGVFGGKL